MISNHKIQAALDEIKEISKIDLALYTDKGKQVAATFETEGDMEYAVNSFAGSMAESQMLSGCHFFKVYVDGELEYVLLTKSSAEDALSLIHISNTSRTMRRTRRRTSARRLRSSVSRMSASPPSLTSWHRRTV